MPLAQRAERQHRTQHSKLLPALFDDFRDDARLEVLHIGPALGNTVEFFSGFRCRMHFVDLFAELPLASGPEDDPAVLANRLHELLAFPPGTRFDICLFWDLFNFLPAATLRLVLDKLHPFLAADGRAHTFSVHNVRARPDHSVYSIRDAQTLELRPRTTPLPGYAPHSQRQLKELLYCFSIERSVLLPDSRLEALLRVRP